MEYVHRMIGGNQGTKDKDCHKQIVIQSVEDILKDAVTKSLKEASTLTCVSLSALIQCLFESLSVFSTPVKHIYCMLLTEYEMCIYSQGANHDITVSCIFTEINLHEVWYKS